MKKEIYFGTKEEHNERRRQRFMALSPAERVREFLRSFDSPAHGSPHPREKNKGNFVIRKKK